MAKTEQLTPEVLAENPFKIKPGEKLTLDQVLDRFLDWEQWNRDCSRAVRGPNCDLDLHHGLLCCADHWAIREEHELFYAYMYHLTHDQEVGGSGGFSMASLKQFIVEHGVAVNIPKIARYHYASVAEWLKCETE